MRKHHQTKRYEWAGSCMHFLFGVIAIIVIVGFIADYFFKGNVKKTILVLAIVFSLLVAAFVYIVIVDKNWNKCEGYEDEIGEARIDGTWQTEDAKFEFYLKGDEILGGTAKSNFVKVYYFSSQKEKWHEWSIDGNILTVKESITYRVCDFDEDVMWCVISGNRGDKPFKFSRK